MFDKVSDKFELSVKSEFRMMAGKSSKTNCPLREGKKTSEEEIKMRKVAFREEAMLRLKLDIAGIFRSETMKKT
jgi:hypothetical protein